MNLSFYIAKRYIFSKKNRNVINLISGISVFGIAISTMAMIVVLSGFNGIESLVEGLYSNFDSDLVITIKKGKTFSSTTFPKDKIKAINGVAYYSNIIEETTILKNNESWVLAKMKGVENDYLIMNNFDNAIKEGKGFLKKDTNYFAITGVGLMYLLNAYIHSEQDITPYELIKVIGLIGTEKLSKQRKNALIEKPIYISAKYAVNPKFDDRYFFVDIAFARNILGLKNEITAVEIGVSKNADIGKVKDKIKQLLGDKFDVKDKFDQNELLFKTHRSEKWMTFFILCFIFILSTFNMIASLSMLIIDKKKDIFTLKSMGANQNTIFRIFFAEGLLINILGGIGGLILGLLLCLGQIKFGWISMGDQAIVNQFPVKIELLDFISIFITVSLVGIVATYFPVKYLVSKNQ